MKSEINLLDKYPTTKRDLTKRANQRSIEDIQIARKFGKDFFDGDRKHGYGGFSYDPKYWTEVVKTFTNYYNLDSSSRVLDVGCAKGFMVYDMSVSLNSNSIYGIDISEYAIENCKPEVSNNVYVGEAHKINFPDKFFDLAISINTIHNYEVNGVKKCLKELDRVSKSSFITVDAYRNDIEKKNMFDWNLTALTILHRDDWIKLFEEVDYQGDYYWFTP
tara:strand:- start:299 stop:955 length:657 start_codon:yes stop_codon:yes gene_type:complete